MRSNNSIKYFLLSFTAIFFFQIASAQNTLYWVSGTGNWSDANHWSATSGGAGGAGIPDDQTSVVFDQNSFSSPGESVTIDVAAAQCFDMEWTTGLAPFNPKLEGDSLNQLLIYSSFQLAEPMEIPFRGDLIFRATDSNNVIDLDGNVLYNDFVFQGTGKWELDTNMYMHRDIIFENGFLQTNGHGIICRQFYSDYTSSRALDMEFSIFQTEKAGQSWFVNTENFDLKSKSSILVMHGNKPELINFGPDTLTFSGVLFTDSTGVARLEFSQCFQVFFTGDGIIEDYNRIDSLYFTPGKTYEITSTVTQYVRGGWFSIGADCYPIKIRSTQPGDQATVEMMNAKMRFEHNVIEDIDVNGTGNFNAGVFSADSGNNTGLIFGQSNLVYSNVLGNDTTLCPGDSKKLTTRYYWNNADRLWHDNSTNQTFTVTEEGTYHVRLTYLPGCHLYDTIRIDYSDVSADLGADKILCEGEKIILETNAQPGWNVEWQDQSTEDSLVVTAGGTYSVTVTDQLGCTKSDNVEITEVALPEADLGSDTAICQDQEISLEPNPDPSLDYEWQDGSNSQTFTASSAGLYHVTVTNTSGCSSSDSLQLTVNNNPSVNIGSDVVICEDDDVIFDLNISNATYLWNTGSTSKSITVNTEGAYSVTVTDKNGCQGFDTVNVTSKPIPEFNIRDTAVCFDRTGPVVLRGPAGVTKYEWSTGDTTKNDTIDFPGTYNLFVSGPNGCSFTDEFTVENDCPTEIYFPNAFTPNGDGKNDLFRTQTVNVTSASYKIYSRWGQLVYATNDEYCNWNGTIGGERAPSGTYIVIATGVDYFGNSFQRESHFQIIR